MKTTGEFLGDRGRGQRDRADEGVEPAVSLVETHRGEGQADDDRRDDEDFHQPADRRLQRRDLVRALDRGPDDLAVERLPAGVGDADAGLAGQERVPANTQCSSSTSGSPEARGSSPSGRFGTG